MEPALRVLLLAGSLALGWILLPLFGPILWSGIIALLFTPVYRRLLPHVGRRPTPAALLTLLLALAIVIVPFTLVSAALAREAMLVYDALQSGSLAPALYLRHLFDALPAPALALLERFGLANFDAVARRVAEALALGSQFVATRAFAFGQDTFAFVAGLFITTYLSFFLIRDGTALARAAREVMPLAAEHNRELVDKFSTVVRATVKGSIAVGVLQGALGGLAFWLLGVGAPLLWAVLMAFLSLVPAVGAALVWFPVAIYFLLAGSTGKGLALLAFGVFVIGLVDNLLRPMLVGKDTRMPDYLVMITTLGGMATFGIHGFVLGPAIAAMFIAIWHIHAATRAGADR